MDADDLEALNIFARKCLQQGWPWMLTRATDASYQAGIVIEGNRFASPPKMRVREALDTLTIEIATAAGVDWLQVGMLKDKP